MSDFRLVFRWIVLTLTALIWTANPHSISLISRKLACDLRQANLCEYTDVMVRQPHFLRLRGGNDVEMSAPATEKTDPRSWSVENVQEFLETLRPKFGLKTDIYRQIFSDNDVDGAILLGLNLQKLESIGIRSLGHREYLFEEIQSIKVVSFQRPAANQSAGSDEPRQAQIGLMRGPRPGDFEAAMAAQNAPSAHPPVKIAAEVAPPRGKLPSAERTCLLACCLPSHHVVVGTQINSRISFGSNGCCSDLS